MRPIDKTIKIIGSQAELARLLETSPPNVHKMLKTGRVPAKHCRKIESATGGAVTAEQLRPDIFRAA